MSRKRAPMRRIKEVLRLCNLGGLSERGIARATNQKKSTVRDYKIRAITTGIISQDTAALWLRADLEHYIAHREDIVSFFA